MNQYKKIAMLLAVVLVAYWAAWGKAYFLSKSYFDYAVEQEAAQNYVFALKGMNKLELRIDDEYLGGYQQVIESWEYALFGIRPAFYEKALVAPQRIIPLLSDDDLQAFIDIYVQLDSKYVPEVALMQLKRAQQAGNEELAAEMEEFLSQAFPEFDVK
ncbi:hypothetical protein [Photobacterium minamisatsumaniensis]|uniref:hypothetical protein n=1 Tax=Photobacterium minamisatsumaniensis TaxID=2910233 RepID=UPI003D0F3952